MSGPIVGVALLVLLVAGGAWGIVLRARRGGLDGREVRWLTIACGIAGGLAGQFFIDAGTGSGLRVPSILMGLLAGSASGFMLAGWDELMDRFVPSLYACIRREVRGLFTTPIPYFVLFLFVLISGLYFWGSLVQTQRVGFREVFLRTAEFGFFLFPLLTMAAFSRERAEGTIEVLMTAPVGEGAVTFSKFVGTMVFYLAMLLPTVFYYAVLRDIGAEIGKPDPGPVLAAYVGMILAGSFFISLGILASSLTSSQILAAILAWVVMLILWSAAGVSTFFGFAGSWVGDALEYLDPLELHLTPFLRGTIDPKDVVFYVSFSAFFLFLASRSVEARKWR